MHILLMVLEMSGRIMRTAGHSVIILCYLTDSVELLPTALISGLTFWAIIWNIPADSTYGRAYVRPSGREVIAAAGAEKAGALYESSGASNRSLEDIAKASKGPKWFQLYFNADAGVTRSLLERAKAAGYSAIIITADALGPGTSDAFLSMSSPFPAGATFGNHDPRYGGKGDF